MENYLQKIKPNVGEAWKAWIAQQVADTKYTANINPLFRQGKEVNGKRPNTLISDSDIASCC